MFYLSGAMHLRSPDFVGISETPEGLQIHIEKDIEKALF